MSDKTGHLTKPQRLALEAFANGAGRDQAAAVADRTRRTVDRWMVEDPAFKAAVTELSSQAVDDGGRRLALLLEEAIQVFEDIMGGEEVPYSIRLKAAQAVISNVIKLREFHELEERVSALEERLQNERH